MLRHDDDYAAAGKPLYDYDDPVALRPWSMRWPATPALLGVLKRRELSAALAQVAELSCWLPCAGQELEEDAGECVGSRAGSSRIGWSPLLIRRPGTARRYVITASTTRRGMSLSTLTRGSSPPPPLHEAIAVTLRPLRISSRMSSPVSVPAMARNADAG